mmetsp:Transcript_96176/g.170731  ORF Transcript_96176/g.170731 Transcript_96176/m.170731 type:complete len:128 (-) Transcript_96176:1137-1520(-)
MQGSMQNCMRELSSSKSKLQPQTVQWQDSRKDGNIRGALDRPSPAQALHRCHIHRCISSFAQLNINYASSGSPHCRLHEAAAMQDDVMVGMLNSKLGKGQLVAEIETPKALFLLTQSPADNCPLPSH